MSLPHYTLKVLNNGVTTGELTRATKIKFGYGINEITEASFRIPIVNDVLDNYEANLINEFSELEIWRNDKIIWSGIDPIISDSTSGNNMSTSFTFIQKAYLLKNRYFTGSFTGVQEGQIAMALINATQTDTKAGLFTLDQVNLGITEGIIETTQTRDRTYVKDSILKSLQQLTEVINGGDFLFSPSILRNSKNKLFYSQNIGVDKPDIIFSYDDGSIQSSTKKVNSRDVTNYVEGTGNLINSTSKFSDNDLIAKSKMRQVNYNNSDFTVLSTLQNTIDGIVSTKGISDVEYDVKLNNTYQFGTFDIGDFVRIRIDNQFTGGRYELDQLMQVLKIQVEVLGTGDEKIAITVGDKKAFKKDDFIGYLKNLDNRLTTKEK